MKKLLVLAIVAGFVLFAGCGTDKNPQAPILSDDAPPLAPTDLAWQVEGNSGVVVLTWAPNTEPDLAGYRVYLFEPDPRRDGAYVLQNPDQLLTEEQWTTPIQYDQVLWVRLTAVDAAGNESSVQRTARITWEPPSSPVVTPPPIKPPAPGGIDSSDGNSSQGMQ
jgi:hypothetical protein